MNQRVQSQRSTAKKAGWIALCSIGLNFHAQALSSLPAWSAQDLVLLEQGELIPGQALLTKEGVAVEKLIDPWRNEREAAEPDLDPEVSRVIEPAPELPDSEPLLDARGALTDDVLRRYFDRHPEHFLVDSQQILSRQEWRDVNFILEEHRDVSPLPVYVFVFGENQKIPEAYAPEIVFDENFGGTGEACVMVYYYFGAPERSSLHLGGGMLEEVELWKKRELLSNSRMKARDKSAPLSQLEDFIGQISMRLYWVEEEFQQKERQRLAALKVEEVAQKDRPLSFVEHLEKWLPSMEGVFPKVAIVAGFISFVGFGWILWVRKRKFLFPEVESLARLGGENGAGFGGVLSFKDPLVPPSEQREQFEDLL